MRMAYLKLLGSLVLITSLLVLFSLSHNACDIKMIEWYSSHYCCYDFNYSTTNLRFFDASVSIIRNDGKHPTETTSAMHPKSLDYYLFLYL